MDTHTTTKHESAMPRGYTSRAAMMDDLPAVHALYAASEIAEIGTAETSLADVQAAWSEPSVNLAEDARLVFDAAGQAVAEADVFRQGPTRVWGYAVVHPSVVGLGLGRYLLEHIEARARDWAARVPVGERVELRQEISARNHQAQALLEAAGFLPIRRSYKMEIDLAEAPAPAPWPAGISVRTLIAGQDEHAVYEAMEEAFADHWGHIRLDFDEYAHWHFSGEAFDPSLNFLAMAGETLAGAALCELRPDGGWVQTLGVRRAFRRSGLGLALLRHAFAQLYALGQQRVGLGVDTQSLTGAVRLYERAGMRAVNEHIQYEKVLHGGMSDDVDRAK